MTAVMIEGIERCINSLPSKCNATDKSCYSQVVGMQIESLYGKSWNIHLVGNEATQIAGATYSKELWISLVNIGTPAYTYYIFKPV